MALFASLLKKPVEAEEEVFWLYRENIEYWEIANDLRGDFSPATTINYISRITSQEQFRETYQRFMEFADAAHNATTTGR